MLCAEREGNAHSFGTQYYFNALWVGIDSKIHEFSDVYKMLLRQR